MGYTVAANIINYSDLAKYKNAKEELNLWAVANYYIRNLSKFEILDVQKGTSYIGFNSELYWGYPSSDYVMYYGELNESDVGDDISEHYTSSQPWYNYAIIGEGFTTIDPTFRNNEDNTYKISMSKSFSDASNTIIGVVGEDVLPDIDLSTEEDLPEKLLFYNGNEGFSYLISETLDLDNLKSYKKPIIGDLLKTVYEGFNGEYELEHQKDTNNEDIIYLTFTFDSIKFVFFENIELVRSKSDGSWIREVASTSMFIADRKVIESSLIEII